MLRRRMNEPMNALSRRQMLHTASCGFGYLAMSGIAGATLDARPPRVRSSAQRVIFLNMAGGPAQLDTFDYKPLLNKLAGQSLPASFKAPITAMGETKSPLLECKRTWKQYGQCGLWISDWFQNVAQHADDLAVIHSCASSGINHAGGVCSMNTGSVFGGRPSLGAWASYGLGTENQNLPGYVVLSAGRGTSGGASLWQSGFLPSSYAGVLFRNQGEPVLNLKNPPGIPMALQRKGLDALMELNQSRYDQFRDPEIASRIAAYELAFRMQAAAPELIDIKAEQAGRTNRQTIYAKDAGAKAWATQPIPDALAKRVRDAARAAQSATGTASGSDMPRTP